MPEKRQSDGRSLALLRFGYTRKMKKPKHPWYKPRGYVHFDTPLNIKAAEQLASDPKSVASHAFYPLIRYTVESQKIERDPAGFAVKKPIKKRPISFAAHADSHIYSYYSSLLSKLYEERLQQKAIDNSVLAFRSLGKSNIHFANDAFELIKAMGQCVAFATDISGFFDNLDHSHLKKTWADLLAISVLPSDHYAVFKSLTRYCFVQKEKAFEALGHSENNPPRYPSRLCSASDFRKKIRVGGLIEKHPDNKGIPQGSPISALLSNIYMLEFDQLLHAEIHLRGGHYMRYCDDVLCIVPASASADLDKFVETLINKFGLKINEDKTETIFFQKTLGELTANRPLQYLGFTFDGTRKLIRSAAFAKFSDKMRQGVSLARQTTRKHNKTRCLPEEIWRRQLYERYSHLGKRNFIRYGLRAAEIMGSRAMYRQLRPLWHRLVSRITTANAKL